MRDWTFGRRLAEARTLSNLTLEQMIERLADYGIKASHATLTKWEHDKSQPRNLFVVVRAWSEITGIDEGWLLQPDAFTSRGHSTPRNRKVRGVTGPRNAHPGGGRNSGFAGLMSTDRAA